VISGIGGPTALPPRTAVGNTRGRVSVRVARGLRGRGRKQSADAHSPKLTMTRKILMISSGNMWLVYVADNGENHFQPWQDLMSAGTLIDPESGDDMEMVGWTTTAPN